MDILFLIVVFLLFRGTVLWKNMVEDEVAPGRTWQSIKQRYSSYPAEQDSPCLIKRALITLCKTCHSMLQR